MPQVFYKDGSAVPDAKVSEAISSGAAYAKGRVTVRDPNGTVGTIDASELGKPGYQPLTDAEINEARIHEERSTLGQQALTAVEGGARGLSLGGSDVVATGLLGDGYRKGAQERAHENRKIAIGSEIAGAIAPTLLTGGEAGAVEGASLAARAGEGASLLNKAARLAPSSLVSSAGRAVERGVAGIVGDSSASMLGRMAQRAAAVGASGAVEGGLYGAGNAVSEAALDGAPITAEKVLGGFGHGALFGGWLGAGLGAAGGLGSSAFERIVGGSEGLKAGAEKLANESALGAVGFQGSDFKKLKQIRGENAVSDLGSELINFRLDPNGPGAGRKIFTGAKKAEDFVDDLGLAKEEVGSKLGAIRQQVDAAGMAPDVESYLARVKAEVLDPLYKSSSPTVRDQAKRVERELALLRGKVEGTGDSFVEKSQAVKALTDADDEAEKAINGYVSSSGGINHYMRDVAKGGARDAAADAEIANLTGVFRKAEENGALLNGRVLRGEPLDAERFAALSKSDVLAYPSFTSTTTHALEAAEAAGGGKRALITFEQHGGMPIGDSGPFSGHSQEVLLQPGTARIISRKIEGDTIHIRAEYTPYGAPEYAAQPKVSFGELDQFRKDLRSVFQPARHAGGGLPAPVPEHAAHLEKAERILADELDKTVEQHLTAMGADASEYGQLKKTYGALADLKKVADRAEAQQLGNRRLSPSDYGIGVAGVLGSMMSGNVGGILWGAGGAIAHKIIRERGNSVLAVMADSVAKMDGRIASAAKSLAGLSAAPRRAALVASSAPAGDFTKTADAVRAFASNPQAAAAALARPVEGIAPDHPQLAAQMQQTLAGDYQYLQTKLPPTLGRAGSSLTPQLEKSRVPKSEQAKFMAVVHALENPASVIEQIAAGELPREQIEALKIRRPEIYNQMRTEAIKAFSIARAPLGILERTRVSLAFDFNGDASLDPQTLAAIQASNRTAPQAEDPPPGMGQQPQKQAPKMNQKSAETLATPSQKAIGS